MRKKLALAITSLAVLVPLAHAAPVEVLVKDNFFKPNRVTIKKGKTVKWIWKGTNVHNVRVKKPNGDKAKVSAYKTEGTFRYTFRRTGTWKAICDVHENMTMKVIVKSS
jgi:plastocyanin